MPRTLDYLRYDAPLARLRRLPRRSAWRVLPLYLALAGLQLFPFLSSRMTVHWEINAFVAGVVEARNALLEGQLPIRVAPHQHEGAGYPVFQFYANLPYTVGGLLDLIPGVGPYDAWRLTMLLALLCGGLYTFRTALLLTRHPAASAIAGAVFLTAPYLFTDVRARGAVSEAVAFNLVPVALFYTLRCLRSPRRRFVAPAAVAWTAVALSHNITYLYGVPFAALLVLSMLRPRVATLRRVARLAAAGLLHALLVLWYFVPQLMVMRDLTISGTVGESPAWSARLVPPSILFWPVQRTPDESTTPRLGLQVGWPVLTAAVVALVLVLRLRRPNPHRATTARLLGLFAVALLLVWSPVDVWPLLPKEFLYVQFTYRLLVFTTVFGALLAACVLATLFPRRIGWRTACVILVVLLAGSVSYVARLPRAPRGYEAKLVADPRMGGQPDYLLTADRVLRTTWSHPDLDLASHAFGLVEDGQVQDRGSSLVPLPDGGATALVMTCKAPAKPGTPVRVTLTADGRAAEATVTATNESATLRVPLDPRGRRAVDVSITAAAQGIPQARLEVTSLRWEGPTPATRGLARTTRAGPRGRFVATLDGPGLVVVPALYYPGLMRVRVNGRPADYGNVGRFVALDLAAAGTYEVEARFTGVRWANAAGLIGMVVLALGGVARLVGRRRAERDVR